MEDEDDVQPPAAAGRVHPGVTVDRTGVPRSVGRIRSESSSRSKTRSSKTEPSEESKEDEKIASEPPLSPVKNADVSGRLQSQASLPCLPIKGKGGTHHCCHHVRADFTGCCGLDYYTREKNRLKQMRRGGPSCAKGMKCNPDGCRLCCMEITFWDQNMLFMLPLIIVIIFPLSLLLNYVIAASLGHISWSSSYISDVGHFPPESSIFSLTLAIGTYMVAIAAYIRYKQVRDVCIQTRCRRPEMCCINVGSFVSAIGFCLGLLTVASFQTWSVAAVHYFGALIAFGCGSLYTVLQSYMSLILYPHLIGLPMLLLRFTLAVLSCVGFVFIVTFGIMARMTRGGPTGQPQGRGITWRVVSVIAEWVTAILMLGFIGTFIPDFRKTAIKPPVFRVQLNRLDLRGLRDDVERYDSTDGSSGSGRPGPGRRAGRGRRSGRERRSEEEEEDYEEEEDFDRKTMIFASRIF